MQAKLFVAAACGALLSTAALAQVDIRDAWARGTVPAQTATGLFMTLHAHEDARLVGVSTPAATTAEVHEMRMEGNVMRMRMLDALPLPKMEDVELKPGGYHVMLLGLKAPLKAGDKVPVTLKIEQRGKLVEQRVEAEVRGLTAPARAGGKAAEHKH